MAAWHDDFGESDITNVPRRERRSGDYRWYEPDRVVGRPLVIDERLSERIADVERTLRSLDGPDSDLLSSVSRFLLRSEAIASSRIEGVAPSAKQVALAELGTSEEVQGLSAQARLVANNLTIVHDASGALAESRTISTADIERLHAALLADEPRLHGLRTRQNWIGGADHHPIDADFVPPAPELVPGLMDDLLTYLGGAADSPLVQAAITHAQFETIHPFSDGNGRVGRALIHTVLTRRGLTTRAVLPISLVLATRRDEYINGLTAYRYDSADPLVQQRALGRWLTVFLDAADDAAAQSRQVVADIKAVRQEWESRLATYRDTQGRTRALRSDSATARILDTLPAAPVLTARTVARVFDVSSKAALAALDELRGADILSTRSIGRGTRAYLADDLLDLITVAERRLASTRFDTRESPPNRVVPAAPDKPMRTTGGAPTTRDG